MIAYLFAKGLKYTTPGEGAFLSPLAEVKITKDDYCWLQIFARNLFSSRIRSSSNLHFSCFCFFLLDQKMQIKKSNFDREVFDLNFFSIGIFMKGGESKF